jgi:hypothetical protein
LFVCLFAKNVCTVDGVRLNVERDQLNSVLIERGDRVAIQGDGHPTIATALEVFYSKEIMKLLKNVLNSTDNAHQRVVDDYIMSYPLYWCLSSINYLWHVDSSSSSSSSSSSDNMFMNQKLIQDISFLLDKRINDFLDSNLDITWFGWDDRIGNGWCFHSKNDVCTREGLLSFAGLGKVYNLGVVVSSECYKINLILYSLLILFLTYFTSAVLVILILLF